MIDLMKVTGTDGKEYRVPVAAVDAIVARNRRTTDAAPGEAEGYPGTPLARLDEAVLGRELIAWAAEEKNVVFWQNIDLEECGFCHATRDAILRERFNHPDDCLHLRARALRDSE